jgi:hypothetical protein
MNNFFAAAKVLDELMLEIIKKGMAVPPHVADDLKSCRSLAGIGSLQPDDAGVAGAATAILQGVEMNLLSLAESCGGAEYADEWQNRINSAYLEEAPGVAQEPASALFPGVPRADHRVLIKKDELAVVPEPDALIGRFSLSCVPQGDRLLIHGRKEDVVSFLKEVREIVIKSRV